MVQSPIQSKKQGNKRALGLEVGCKGDGGYGGYSEAALGLNLKTQNTRTIMYKFCNTTSFILQ